MMRWHAAARIKNKLNRRKGKEAKRKLAEEDPALPFVPAKLASKTMPPAGSEPASKKRKTQDEDLEEDCAADFRRGMRALACAFGHVNCTGQSRMTLWLPSARSWIWSAPSHAKN